MSRERAAGFTLIEVMGAVLLTAVVVTGATAFYLRLSDAAERARDHTAQGRHASAVLDRLARDLEGAFLVVKPEEKDPLDHPWLFLAEERRGSDGADRLKWVIRNHRSARVDGPSSGLALVSWELIPGDDETFELWRRARLSLPEGLDRRFDDEGGAVVAENVASFGVSLMTEDGEWVSTWDSSTLANSSQLPLAAEIRLALREGDPGADASGPLFTRRVLLPLRPLDLQEEVESGPGAPGEGEDDEDEDEETDDGEEGEDEDGVFGDGDGDGAAARGQMTVRQCLGNNQTLVNRLAQQYGMDPAQIQAVAASVGDQPVSNFPGLIPPGVCGQ